MEADIGLSSLLPLQPRRRRMQPERRGKCDRGEGEDALIFPPLGKMQ